MKPQNHSMRDLGMESLVGLTVLKASINAQRDCVSLETDKGNYFLSWVGECCASCFIAEVDGASALEGHKILGVESTEWVPISQDDAEVLESMGTKIRTSGGYVSISTRLEHNGYYGGNIRVSKDYAMDQYRFPRNTHGQDFKPLKDF